MNATVEVRNLGLQVSLVFVPAHSVDSDGGLLLELMKARDQQFFVDMVKKRCEFELAALASRFTHTEQPA